MSPVPERCYLYIHPWLECRKRLSSRNHPPRRREPEQYSECEAVRFAPKACSRSGLIIRCRGTEFRAWCLSYRLLPFVCCESEFLIFHSFAVGASSSLTNLSPNMGRTLFDDPHVASSRIFT